MLAQKGEESGEIPAKQWLIINFLPLAHKPQNCLSIPNVIMQKHKTFFLTPQYAIRLGNLEDAMHINVPMLFW